ncbi:hypothetical protein BDV24DRAFT_42706 [Aspergillus arachidicola]|uniref:Uncharacterized protein n=1 Tax=Aspergillus arachidicola TaxID=656916 RepID=A0A5N6YG24_9EURO|nr:hypothetical protein BDV24DRAFT_42706 [Aspergillus arachidicola]
MKGDQLLRSAADTSILLSSMLCVFPCFYVSFSLFPPNLHGKAVSRVATPKGCHAEGMPRRRDAVYGVKRCGMCQNVWGKSLFSALELIVKDGGNISHLHHHML